MRDAREAERQRAGEEERPATRAEGEGGVKPGARGGEAA